MKKTTAMVATLACAAALGLAAMPTWLTVTGTDPTGLRSVAAGGSALAPGVPAAALATGAAAVALALVGRIGRVLAGLAVVVAGLIATANAMQVAAAPGAERVWADAVGATTGISDVASTPWPWITAAIGVATVAIGLAVAATRQEWSSVTRVERAPTDLWAAQDAGYDPTAEAEDGTVEDRKETP